MAIINGNKNAPVNFPNLPAGASTNATFSGQQTKVQGDLDDLSQDKATLDTLNSAGQYLTPDQAHQATQAAAQLKTDSAQFQSDQQTLLQLASQDNNPDEAASASDMASTANGTINGAVQDAAGLESQHALDNGLGGTTSSDIGVYHQNINAAAGSANQVASMNTQSPVGVTSPFGGGMSAASNNTSGNGTSNRTVAGGGGSSNTAGTAGASNNSGVNGSAKTGGAGTAHGVTTTTADSETVVGLSSGASINISTQVQVTNGPPLSTAVGGAGSSASVGGSSATGADIPSTAVVPPAIPVTGGGSVNTAGSANSGGAGTANSPTAGAAVTTASITQTVGVSTAAGLVNEQVTVSLPVDPRGNPTTTATVHNESVVSYSTAAGASTETIDVTMTVGPGGVSTGSGSSVSSNSGTGGAGNGVTSAGAGGSGGVTSNTAGATTSSNVATITSQGVTYSFPNVSISSNVSTSFGVQSAKVQNDLTALQRDNSQLNQLLATSGNLNASQATMAVSIATQLKNDATSFNADQGTLLQVAVRDNNINEADTAIYAYGDAAQSAISSGAQALWG